MKQKMRHWHPITEDERKCDACADIRYLQARLRECAEILKQAASLLRNGPDSEFLDEFKIINECEKLSKESDK